MINYFANPERTTPFNIAAGRIIVSMVMLWKLVGYEWGKITEWPVGVIDTLYLFEPNWIPTAMPVLAAVAALALVGVLVGYHLRLSAFVAAFLIVLLSTIRFRYQPSHSSEFVWVIALILLLFGLYADDDKLTVDEFRRTGDRSFSTLTDHLESVRRESYPVSALKWSLLVIAVLYFQSGLGKLLTAPLEWIRPASLGRYILFSTVGVNRPLYVGEVMLDYPLLLSAAAIGTIILEFGFLPALIAKRRVDVFVLGLFGMHVGILFSLGPNFTDLMAVLLAFAPWDQFQRRLQPDETLRVVYDEQCYFCARSLSLFPYLDVDSSVEFYSQRTAPESLLDRDADFDRAMFAFRDSQEYRGYHAFQGLFAHLGLLAPLTWIMRLPIVSDVGERIYDSVAANRSRIATCSLDDQ